MAQRWHILVRAAALLSLVYSCTAQVSGNCACAPSGPTYSVLLGGAQLFGNSAALQIFANGTWQSRFELLRAQPVSGQDSLGTYDGVTCTYNIGDSSNVVQLSVLTYPALAPSSGTSAVRFTSAFPSGLSDTRYTPTGAAGVISLFPAFTAALSSGAPSNVLTWAGPFMRPAYDFATALGMAGGPVLYYGEDVSGPAVLVSPLDEFLSASLGDQVGVNTSCDANPGCWAAGVSSTFTALPPGFESSWIILSDAGITPLIAAYRAALLAVYAFTAAKLSDVSISGLSYTTDNGGQLTFGCPGGVLDTCLINEAAYLKQIGAPIQMLSFQNAPMVSRGETAPWCVSEFVPDPRRVPMGIQAFQKAVGLPLQLYMPYLCNSTYYTANYTLLRSNVSLPGCTHYDFFDPAPIDSRRFFEFIMDLVLDYGATLYETDFMNVNTLCVDEYISTVGAADAYLAGMAEAARVRGIAVQFCFATPHVMLWTLTAPAVTNARVSFDFYYGSSWDIGVSSLMAWGANSAPSKDTLWSSDNGNQSTTRGGCSSQGCPPDHSSMAAVLHTILAVLSTGPVGYSDAPNETDITLVMRTCDSVGNLLQPSRPIIAIDSTHDVTPGAQPSGYVLATHTSTAGMDAPALYFILSHHLKTPFGVRGLDVWPRMSPGQTYAVANWSAVQGCSNGSALAACGVALQNASLNASAVFITLLPEARPFQPTLTLVAPVCRDDIALLGEVDKVATISIQRFVAITCSAGSGEMSFTLYGQSAETVRVAFIAGGAVRFLSWTFPATGLPSTTSCVVSETAASCGAAVHAPSLQTRAGSGMDVVLGARARVATPRVQPLRGTLHGALPAQLVAYVEELHGNMSRSAVARSQPLVSRHTGTPPVDAVDAVFQDMLAAALAAVDPVQATQDCMAFALAYEYALRIMPSRAPHREVWDALRLGPDCGATPPPSQEALGILPAWPPQHAHASVATDGSTPTFYVSPSGDDVRGNGSEASPFATVQRALNATRSARAPGTGPAAIVLRQGLHVLGETIQLDARDAQLSVMNYPGESAFVSGGAPLNNLTWIVVNVTNSSNVYVAHVPHPPQYITSLVTVNSTDASPPKRLFRAQYPSFNPEMHATAACGGGDVAASRVECIRDAASSPFIRETARRLAAQGRDPWAAAGSSQGLTDTFVTEWIPPPHFSTPEIFFRDLYDEGLKNDSLMMGYNQFSVGRGGACGLWTNAWPATSPYGWDYHCGNVSAGGWEFVDEYMYTIGQLNLPFGAILNTSAYSNSATWAPNTDATQRDNGAAVMWVWHTQGWFLNSFYITDVASLNATALSVNMSGDGVYPLGGWQGGRHWETYGSFHGGTPEGPLLGGGWWISNLFQELDAFDEFYFDVDKQLLYVFWNASNNASGDPFASPPPANGGLMAPQLEVFFNISGTADITVSGVGFRDQRNTMMEPWIVPSGGDWGLRPAGAINVQDSERITVSDVLFSRTDSNAIFLGGYNRNVSILDSEFVWIGMSAVASMGLTDFQDGTAGQQPWGTVMSGIFVHELALVEKQSSAYFSGRTPLARLESSIMFNGPRAMININDNFGQGSNFTTNLLFNSCRESGDHGNMNSSNLTGTVSFMNQLKSETSLSFGIGNYGASQVFDNDDGSNAYYTHHNFFYQSDGYKADYSGHDCVFESNVVVVRAYDGQNCINSVPFVPGHEDALFNNTCVVMAARNPWDRDMVIQGAGGWCAPTPDGSGLMRVHDNKYFTLGGNASLACGGQYGTTIVSYRDAHPSFEANSTVATLPAPDTIIQWGRDVLGM